MMFEEPDVGMAAQTFQQGPFDLMAGEILGVEDPASCVTSFAPEVVKGKVVGWSLSFGLGLFIESEPHSPVDQFVNQEGSFLDQVPDNILVTETGTRDECVLDMGLK